MEFNHVIDLRQSTRAFLPKQITQEELNVILHAAKCAPIGSSMYQDIHLTVVQNQELLLHLCEAAWERFSSKAKIEEIAGDAAKKTDMKEGAFKPNLFYGAPTVIFVSHRKQTVQPGIEYSNTSTVVNQMHLAATSIGLGSCYMWGALESMRMLPHLDHTGELGLPDDFEPLIALAIGYPKDALEVRNNGVHSITINHIK